MKKWLTGLTGLAMALFLLSGSAAAESPELREDDIVIHANVAAYAALTLPESVDLNFTVNDAYTGGGWEYIATASGVTVGLHTNTSVDVTLTGGQIAGQQPTYTFSSTGFGFTWDSSRGSLSLSSGPHDATYLGTVDVSFVVKDLASVAAGGYEGTVTVTVSAPST
ncbi:hypothetical protein [Limnochorda pilosa]|uniref:Uncharacterized protein n=1 Tax=Limnochorda pilosa TaxID=1555112 RepID=A0A0K2SKW4_LIMPI|nr:hypothetical protein [Limnochorda pilosa]BAS27735.1 hypothetical protein LIP_1894 [Limnochorda pilosa]